MIDAKIAVIILLFLLTITFATLFGVYYQKYNDKNDGVTNNASMKSALESCTSNLEAAYMQLDNMEQQQQPTPSDITNTSTYEKPTSYANIMTAFDGTVVSGETSEDDDYSQYATFVRG